MNHNVVIAVEEVVDFTPAGHLDARDQLDLIERRDQLYDQFQQSGNFEELDEAVRISEIILETIPFDHPGRASPLSKLGSLLCERFKRTGEGEDLDWAITHTEMAVHITHPDQIDRGAWLTTLATRLGVRFDWRKRMEDIDRAIQFAGLAVEITPPGNRNLSGRLQNLGNALCARYEEAGDRNDLERAVEAASKAVDTSPEDQCIQLASLVNFANIKGTCFQMSGSMEDLKEAIDAAELASESMPFRCRDERAIFANLANWLGTRYTLVGDMEDLDSAIGYSARPLLNLPSGHTKNGAWLDNWCNWLSAQFERTGQRKAIDSAIESGELALMATIVAPGRPERATILANLARRHGQRFETYRDINDLNRGITRAKLALETWPSNPQGRCVTRTILGKLLSMRFSWRRDIADLNQAIQLTREAMQATYPHYPGRARWLGNLADYLEARFQHTKNPDDIQGAQTALQEGWSCHNAPPLTRISLARRASAILSGQSQWDEASELLEGAVALLPTVSQRSLQNSDKQHRLKRLSGLGSLAAATALNAGKAPYHALQVLELGRGVIAGILLDVRSDVSILRQRHSDLADELVRLRDILDTSAAGRRPVFRVDEKGASHSLQSRTKRRREAEYRLTEIFKEIRLKPGFESFLASPSEEELRAAAAPGPIVVINATSYRCDAFLIRNDRPIEVLKLSKMNLKDIKAHSTNLLTGGSLDLRQTLEWLWDVAASPILDALGYTRGSKHNGWPHVWWIPTGELSKLPFHAAGRHQRDCKNAVIDRVMSSYSLSIKALMNGRKFVNTTCSTEKPGKAVIVTVSGSNLPSASAEARILQELCPSLKLEAVIPVAQREEILKNLENCKIFHFASHGQSNPSDPSSSCLVLNDEREPLTVSHLRDCKLQEKSPFLAYLSACSTKVNEVNNLIDEDIHLVSACQLAGFRHVVGTLWTVSDRHSVGVAQDLYETLRDGGMNDSSVCMGLHLAVRRLRSVDIAMREEARPDGHCQVSGSDETSSLNLGQRTSFEADGTTVNRDGFAVGFSTNTRSVWHGGDPRIWAAYVHVGP